MERIYTIPLRDVRKTPRTKRALKAVKYIRAFVEKHMKSKDVKLDDALNKVIWARGIRNIPTKVKVKASKQEDGSVLVTFVE